MKSADIGCITPLSGMCIPYVLVDPFPSYTNSTKCKQMNIIMMITKTRFTAVHDSKRKNKRSLAA